MGCQQIKIEPEQCSGCGLCISVCPSAAIAMIKGRATMIGDHCMECGHCLAACPQQAITAPCLDPRASSFESFTSSESWLPPGGFDTGLLVQLMRSRRSVRNYMNRAIPLALLNDLVKIGATAPSGTNSQKWSFTILPGRAEVAELGERVAIFFERLNRRAANPLLRWLLRLAGRDELQNYYDRHYESVSAALADWRNEGVDHLFHGAPAAILVGSQPGASCPAEDALLASQNILLAAHCLGLGSCLIGYVVEAMKRDRAIQQHFKIPETETIHAVIALGYGAEKYQTVSGRKKIASRIFRLAD